MQKGWEERLEEMSKRGTVSKAHRQKGSWVIEVRKGDGAKFYKLCRPCQKALEVSKANTTGFRIGQGIV